MSAGQRERTKFLPCHAEPQPIFAKNKEIVSWRAAFPCILWRLQGKAHRAHQVQRTPLLYIGAADCLCGDALPPLPPTHITPAKLRGRRRE